MRLRGPSGSSLAVPWLSGMISIGPIAAATFPSGRDLQARIDTAFPDRPDALGDRPAEPGPPSPARSARAISGTSPARDTRFGSSNDTCVLAGLCNNRAYEVSSRTRRRKCKTLPASQFRGHL